MKKSEFITIGLQYGLQKKQIENVICSVLAIETSQFLTLDDIDADHLYEVQKAFYNLSNGQPQEYVYKNAEFWSSNFYVDNRVLIPRVDTEVLVDEAIKEISRSISVEDTSYLDIGTGSGCIALSILKAIKPLKFAESYGVDTSPEALQVARINEKNLWLEGDIVFLESDLLSQFSQSELYPLQKNLCITANLPYIKNDDFEHMAQSVIDHEPETALYGGEQTGFELYEKLIKQCFQLKNVLQLSSITLFIEIGFDQHEVSKTFLEELGLQFEYFEDSSNIKRVIKIYSF